VITLIKSPDLWLQSYPVKHHKIIAWQMGGDHLCVRTPITKLLTQCYVKCEVDSLENVVRFKCEAHVFINFGPNNSLEIVFTQPVP
jgi:hypothetical protein